MILLLQPGIESGPSAVKALSPSHWTTQEFPQSHSLISLQVDFNNKYSFNNYHKKKSSQLVNAYCVPGAFYTLVQFSQLLLKGGRCSHLHSFDTYGFYLPDFRDTVMSPLFPSPRLSVPLSLTWRPTSCVSQVWTSRWRAGDLPGPKSPSSSSLLS